ncbi:flagellar export chaperone FliS [Natronincola ferrireducens]|uniref:Flagellar protein FliS n=1 Tax=Natronincola ferrireducens TaxID=393762 RepID=A0A1G8XT41_9FIRM|nr:flagellar protein FliS [Natronincola ferrireducens]SDJ93334.1 flagellar protein FliS [Natronincola ferrireducens]
MIEKEYLANRVANANGAELVAILYEGFIDTLEDSIDYLKIGAFKKLNDSLQKAREILAELLSTLQGDSEIANNLRSIYLYVNQLMTEGESHRDTDKLEMAIKIMAPIYEGWRELGDQEDGQNQQEILETPKIVAGITYGKGQLKDYVMNDENKWEKG